MEILNNNRASARGTLRSIGEILRGVIPHMFALNIKIADIKEHWVDVVGRALAERSYPVMFEYESNSSDVYLLIHVSSPAAAQRVKMLGSKISCKLKDLWQIDIIGVRLRVI
jgi:hypothetical protein